MSDRVFQTGQGRVFLQLQGAGPAEQLKYQGLARMGGFSLSAGEPARVQRPSPLAYDQFDDIDEVAGESSRPTTSMIARFGLSNPILDATCPVHVQVHWGKCSNPQDLNRGWEIILDYEHAIFTSKSGDEQTALDEAGRATILLTGELSARKMWQIKQMSLSEVAAAEIAAEIVAVIANDYISCGECGYVSDGSQRFFAVAKNGTVGSPGLSAELLVSTDKGATLLEYDITTLAVGEQPTGAQVIGQYVVVVSTDSDSMHIADLNDLSTWQEVLTGFPGGSGEPINITALSSAEGWICGKDGYIYKVDNAADGVVVQHAGSVLTDDLYAIHANSSREVLAGGDSGALLVSHNGGETWAAPTVSPTVARITTVWMRSSHTWIVGDANGYLYYTVNGGVTWTTKSFPMAGLGSITGISFASHPDSPFGFLSATNAVGKGFIFRTLDGGNSWYQLPDTAATTPDNEGLSCVSAGASGNFVVAGGLKTGIDGIVIVGA